MNRFTAPALLLMLAGLLLAQPAHAQHAHDSHHATVDLTTLQLDNGKRWSTDAPLRKGMLQIRDAFESRHDAYRAGKLTTQDYQGLDRELGQAIEYILANCSLSPAADAELHKLLAVIMGARHRLAQREADGMIELHRAVTAYPKYFDHPGWAEKP